MATHRFANRLARHPVLLLSSVVTLSSIVSAQEPPTIEWGAGRLSVSAERVPLAQILGEVARRTGIEVQGLDALQEPVSVRFADVPLREGLEKLLAQRDYAILGDLSLPSGKPPVRVLVSGQRVPPAAKPPEPTEPTESEPAAPMEEPGTEIEVREEEPGPEVQVVGEESPDAEEPFPGLLAPELPEAPGTASVEPAGEPAVKEEAGTVITVEQQEPASEVKILGEEGGKPEE